MPVAIDLPKPLRPYRFHGVEFSYHEGADRVTATCPFCGREGKMGITLENADDGRYRCVVCDAHGNPIEFLRQLHARSFEAPQSYEWLEAHRGIPIEALRAWGVCKSITTGEWIVPAYGANGAICQLYRYVRQRGGEKHVAIGTPTFSAGVFGFSNFDESKEHVFICEGPWDGMALWNRLRAIKQSDDGFTPTANEELALSSGINVLATPGCMTFPESWLKFLDGKKVTLLYDNDYPIERDGKIIESPGFAGVKHAVNVMVGTSEDRPSEIRYLDWSGEGKGYTKEYADGFDVRDLLRIGLHAESITTLFSMLKPVPPEWIEGKEVKHGANRGDYVRPEPCHSWKELTAQWKRAAEWTPELNGALAVLLASITSVPGQGEQVWVRLISPPSTFKSKLCSALAVARKYIVEDDGMNGFFSGYKDAKKGEEVEDRSLVARLYYKTLITKEGATLIDSPMKDVIISQARTLYDGSASRNFNNGIRWEHHGLRFTWILSGTPTLRKLDQSELGQRFVDYVIMEEIESGLEEKIMETALDKQLKASTVMSNCKVETTLDTEYLKASKLTGGYIDHLRKSVDSRIGEIEVSKVSVNKIGRFATFIEYMRARPSSSQEESADRALGTRVGGQLLKLAQNLAVVMDKKSVDRDIMKIIHKVAMDTAKGRTLDIITALYKAKVGLSATDVARLTVQSPIKEQVYLAFLRKIKAVEIYDPAKKTSLSGTGKWRLTEAFKKLYREVMKT